MNIVDALQAIDTVLEAKGIKCFIGAEHLGKNLSPPRVVWVFADGDGDFGKRQTGEGNVPGAPRSIATRLVRFDVHLWARRASQASPVEQDYGSLQLLADAVLFAIRRTLGPGSFTYEGERYPDFDTGNQLHQLGRRSILSGFFDVPVVEDPADSELTTWAGDSPDDFEQHGTMVFPASEVVDT